MPEAIATEDLDGLPPGIDPVDLPLWGKKRLLRFTGPFYAHNYRYADFTRPVQVLLPLKDILVLQDTERKNLYIVDRKRNLSLGCGMHAVLLGPRPLQNRPPALPLPAGWKPTKLQPPLA